MIEYVYSLDNEYFCDIDEIISIVESDSTDEEISSLTVYQGEKQSIPISYFVDGQSILEQISQGIYDEFNDYSDDYCDQIHNIPKEKLKEFEDTVVNFLQKEVGEPPFFSVKNITEIHYKDIL